MRSTDISSAWNKDRLKSELVKALDLLNIHQDREDECVAMLKQALMEMQDFKAKQEILVKEVRDLKAQNELFTQQIAETSAESKSIQPQMATVTEQYGMVKTAVAQQQRALEHLENKDRERNLIVTGVPEKTGDKRWEEDAADIEDLLVEIECPGVVPAKVMRLGKPREENAPPRPLLVITNTITEAKLVLENAKKLKESTNDDHRKVYIKKDTHPAVRKEWKRLRDYAKLERSAPTNVGCIIRVDYKKRAVTKDGEVVCKFVSPFQ